MDARGCLAGSGRLGSGGLGCGRLGTLADRHSRMGFSRRANTRIFFEA